MKSKEIPYNVGVFVPKCKSHFGDWYDLKSVKNARRKDRIRPASEMLLMMFRSAARSEKQNRRRRHFQKMESQFKTLATD